ncbi:hypothetical protein BH11PSE2_BH11PSE2_09660 [soil metagenome]
MIRVLILIAVAGFVVAMISIGGAVALGGRDMVSGKWSPTEWGKNMQIHFDGGDGYDGEDYGSAQINWDGPTTSRSFDWNGDEEFKIAVPADVTYTQGDAASLIVEGPQDAVDRVILDDGMLRFKRHSNFRLGNMKHLKVTMVRPDITKFTLMGSETLTLVGYRQDELKMVLAGSGSIKGTGEARRVELTIAGSGDADLGGISSDDAEVRIAGSGDATIAPKVNVEVHIAGSGNVTLLTRPPSVSTHIAGSGKIIQGDAPAVAAPAAPPAEAAKPAPPAPPAKQAPAAKPAAKAA